MTCADPENFLRGVQLQTRVGPASDPPPLDPCMNEYPQSIKIIMFTFCYICKYIDMI